MKHIEFEFAELENGFLLGIHLMNGMMENKVNREVRECRTLQIGFIFFTLSIYF